MPQKQDEPNDTITISLSAGARRLLHMLLANFLEQTGNDALELIKAIPDPDGKVKVPKSPQRQEYDPDRLDPVVTKGPKAKSPRLQCPKCPSTFKSDQLVKRHLRKVHEVFGHRDPIKTVMATAPRKERRSGSGGQWGYGPPSTPLQSVRIVAPGGSSRYVTIWENDPERLYFHREDGAIRLRADGTPVLSGQHVKAELAKGKG